jgi:hypothetical protein
MIRLLGYTEQKGMLKVERLYLDNYRGFSSQFIEIHNVNFMVGENSTGKSSVLLAMNTVFNQSFWSHLDFSVSEGQGYSFDDFVSAESTDKSYFRLGYLFDNSETASFLFEFINDSGKPILSRAVFSMDEQSFYFNIPINKDTITYRIIEKGEPSFDAFSSSSEWKIFESVKLSQPVTPSSLMTVCMVVKGENIPFVLPIPAQNTSFTAPIRSKPRKTYDEPATPVTSEGGHIPYLLRKLFNENGTKLRKTLNEFGKQGGLFNDIVIKEYGNGFDDAPFRMNFVLDKVPINIVNIGYGVSQIFPVLFELFTGKGTLFEIQQPEVHLHPRAQAALGDVFFDLSVYVPTEPQGKRFLVETHSDYIIDRFRQRQKKADVKADAHVLFFSRKEGKNRAYSINIDGSGAYAEDQPEGFREFFITEAMENLGI